MATSMATSMLRHRNPETAQHCLGSARLSWHPYPFLQYYINHFENGVVSQLVCGPHHSYNRSKRDGDTKVQQQSRNINEITTTNVQIQQKPHTHTYTHKNKHTHTPKRPQPPQTPRVKLPQVTLLMAYSHT